MINAFTPTFRFSLVQQEAPLKQSTLFDTTPPDRGESCAHVPVAGQQVTFAGELESLCSQCGLTIPACSERPAFELYEVPASEVIAGDSLLNEDYDPVGDVIEVANFTVKNHAFTSLRVQGDDSTTVYSFDATDLLAILRGVRP